MTKGKNNNREHGTSKAKFMYLKKGKIIALKFLKFDNDYFPPSFRFTLHTSHSFPSLPSSQTFPQPPFVLSPQFTPPSFLFKKEQVSHGYQQTITYQVEKDQAPPPQVLRLAKVAQYEE